MKNQEFIELLNLYIDHEISAEQASRLETEVMRDPGRRNTYEQYCRMQKACRLLAVTTDESAPTPNSAASFSPSRTWAGRLYAGGLVAAAACVAFAVVLRHGRNEAPVAEARSAAVEPLGLAQPAPALQPAVNLKPVFAARPDALFVETERTPRLDWISQVRFAPVQNPQAADLVFADIPADLKPVNRPIRISPGIQAPVETTAFQITK